MNFKRVSIVFGILNVLLPTVAPCTWNADRTVPRWSARQITLKPDKDEMRVFARPVNIRRKDDSLFVGDYKECCVRVFALDGTYRRTIGKKGEGPGEFKRISDFDVYDDRIFVLEDQRVKILDLNGAPKSTFKVSGDPFKVIVLDNDHIVVSVLPDVDKTGSVPLVYCYDSRGNCKWRCLNSMHSDNFAENTMWNDLLLVKGSNGEFFAIRKANERAIHRLNNEGKELKSIKIAADSFFKEIKFFFKGHKVHFFDFCQDAFWHKDELFVLLKESRDTSRGRDTVPGKEIAVLGQDGALKRFIDLPVPFIKILGAQDNVIFGIDHDDHELLKMEIVTKK